MTIAKHIQTIISGSSWIRKMFEEGARLKAEHGAENVYDFSLGNPNLEPPEKFRAALKQAAASSIRGFMGICPIPDIPMFVSLWPIIFATNKRCRLPKMR